MTEKPLHIQVAEALGWPYGDAPLSNPENWPAVSRYDTNWAVTGPIIEEYGFWLKRSGRQWMAFRNDDLRAPICVGPTPLIAVCRLVIALAAAGQLEAA